MTHNALFPLKHAVALFSLTLLLAGGLTPALAEEEATPVSTPTATATSPAATPQKYQSRLSRLLIRKSNVYLPTRLVLGEEARFVLKAQPGSVVKVLMSSQSEGYTLPSGTALRVGDDAQVLSGTVPETGVLELKMDMPKDPELEGKVVYVDAVAGMSEDNLEPMDLVDATGHRTGENTLVIMKPAERGGPAIMPNMPGISPQMFNQITQLGDIYSKGGKQKDLLDNGDINRELEIDQNPFAQRGVQPGIGVPR